ncbi:MAG: neutral/alkaline non-lysosomal ceramidase N-terminal domain-containing protein [Acidobacteriota bacterium]|nr:MAG: neutral/alkaline non-lysosomal ceramidase N-terminal domain-containing protein [Acidobacteriota bacterium]
MEILRRFTITLLCLIVLTPLGLAWKAGTAKVVITPETPIWMAGYAARDKPAQGTGQDLYAKALALEDIRGNRVVLITTDLLGFSDEFISGVAKRIADSTGLSRDRLLFNASHTHSGPALARVLDIAYLMSPEQKEAVASYTLSLADKLVSLVETALSDLQPCKVTHGYATASFAINRRVETSSGFVIGANRAGPVDHSVPVLAIDSERGSLRAVVFGYSCHNTTLQGSNYHYHGDYAGVAQEWLEKRYPDSIALFVTGTGGDSNPYPRGTRELAEEHGASLGRAVADALTGPLYSIAPSIGATFDTVDLEFKVPPSRSVLEKQLEDENPHKRLHAKKFLAELDANGSIDSNYSYPVQIWNLGNAITLVALGGEVVGDYGFRIKREIEAKSVWVAGYSNDVSCYIPSRRILREGGYEAEESMIYYGRPGSFQPTVEDRIMAKVHELSAKLREEE